MNQSLTKMHDSEIKLFVEVPTSVVYMGEYKMPGISHIN